MAARTSATPAALLRRHRCTRAPVARTSSKMVCSATVSATTGTPDRPSRVATAPLAATPLPSQRVLRPQPHGVAEGGGVLQRALQHQRVAQRHARPARSRRSRPRSARPSRSAPRLARPRVSAPSGNSRHAVSLRGAELEHLHQARLVERRVGVGRADQAGDAAGRGRRASRSRSMPSCSWPGSRRRAARSTRPGATMQAGGVDRALGARSRPARGRCATMRPAAMATSARSSRPDAGSMTRPLWMRIFMRLSVIAGNDRHHRHAHRDAEGHLRQDHALRCRRPPPSRSRRRG